MEKWIMLMATILYIFMLGADCSSPTYYCSIDCGATSTSKDEITGLTWETDEQFIKTGQNNFLPMRNITLQMKTLRSFPNGLKNCYNLDLKIQTKFLLRAGFYYGNYDNLLKPPTFLLKVSAGTHKTFLNVTVTTSLSDDPIYHEIMFVTTNETVDVCLIQTQEDHVPFISSLEAIFVDSENYRFVNNDTPLYLESRINYGANQTVPDHFGRQADPYIRIWKPQEVPNYRSLSKPENYTPVSYSRAENNPPYMVLVYAIEAPSSNSSIFIPINFHEKSQLSAYFVFYFATVFTYPRPNHGTRNVAIYIDGQEKNITRVPYYNEECAVVSIYPVNITAGVANVTIAPAEGTTLPPLLNAMEVFTAIEISKAAHLIPLFGLYLVFFPFSWYFLALV